MSHHVNGTDSVHSVPKGRRWHCSAQVSGPRRRSGPKVSSCLQQTPCSGEAYGQQSCGVGRPAHSGQGRPLLGAGRSLGAGLRTSPNGLTEGLQCRSGGVVGRGDLRSADVRGQETRAQQCILAALICVLISPVAAQIQRPNVIILMADQLSYESCGFAGDAKAITPNIDRLQNDGMSFDNYVVNTPASAATRATLWTGKYASSHGVVINALRLNPNHDALGHLLTAKGYTCDYIGQWHLWANQPGRHEFTENAYCPPGPYRLGFDGYWAAYNLNHNNFKAFYFRDKPLRKEIAGWAPVLFTEMAIGRVQRHADKKQPFAMVVSYSAPHGPWTKENVPEWWYRRFGDAEFELPESMRVYYATTAALDQQIGRLLQSVEDAGIADNTIVIFTSVRGLNSPTFLDKSVRVPMLVRWPGKIPAGRRSNACISAVDLMPTICGMLGVGFPDSVDGIDLSDVTRVDCSCEPDFAFLQGMAGVANEWKDGFEWRAIRDQQFTYARFLVDDKELLFDNRNDPQQILNLAKFPEHAKTLKRLRQWMNEKMLAVHDDFKPCTWYRDNWSENRVIMRGAKGEFRREMGDDIDVDVKLRSVEE